MMWDITLYAVTTIVEQSKVGKTKLNPERNEAESGDSMEPCWR